MTHTARELLLPVTLLAVLVACRPYDQEQVSVEVTPEVTLSCTLALPEGRGPFPAVALISGSGLQTRDSDLWGFKIFRSMADHLARQSTVVLRCDDRGCGRSTGNGWGDAVTTQDFAFDALAQVTYLKSRPEVETRRIGLLGISEGALAASMAGARSADVEFVVLLAGPAVPLARLLTTQLEASLRLGGADESVIRRKVELWERIYDGVRQGADLSGVRHELRQSILHDLRRLPVEERAVLGDLEAYAADRAERSLGVVTSKWGRFLVAYDPRTDQSRMSARTLAVYGGKDSQVQAAMNAAALEQTFERGGKRDYRIELIDEANHIFQKAETGSTDEYGELPREFVPGFLELITGWIHEPAAWPAASKESDDTDRCRSAEPEQELQRGADPDRAL